jgi:chromosomal replication initiation ATPase DnaA
MASGTARQLAFDLPHRSASGWDDFLVATPNAAAVSWIDRWPDWPGPGLALYGSQGSGKTHLLRVWQRRCGARLLQPDDLADLDFGALLASPAPIALDDCDGQVPEAPLLHLYNLLASAGSHLLIAGREAPNRWPITLPDLRSRLGTLPAIAISAPDDALLASILVKLFADRQLRVDNAVIEYLLPRMERSFAAAQRLVRRLDRSGLALGRAVTVSLARSALEDEQREP